MATSIRSQRLIDAKREVEKAKTLVSKIAALRELLSVPGMGRHYRRWSHKRLIEFRAEAVAASNDELLRRLDSLDERLDFLASEEKSRLARKHARGEKLQKKKKTATPVPAVPAPAVSLMDKWASLIEEES